jgi:GAF domain-containing protein
VTDFAERVAQRIARDDRLLAVSRTHLLDTEPEEAFDRLTSLAARLLATPFAFVTLVDDRRSYWKSTFGLGPASKRQNAVHESFCQYVIGEDDCVLIDDTRRDERSHANPSIDTMGVLAWAGQPIRSAAGEVLGTFCVVDRVPRTWSDDDALVLRTLADAAAGEMQLRTALADAGLAQRRAERLAHLARRMSAASTTDEVVIAMVEDGAPVVDADYTHVGVVDRDRELLDVMHPSDAVERVAERYSRLSITEQTPMTDAVREDRLVFIRDHATRMALYPHTMADAAALGVEASTSVPLRDSDGSIIGTVGFAWAQATSLDRPLRTLLDTIADLCGQALQRALLADQRSSLVEALQVQLLPAIPRRDGLEIAVRYLPANDRLGLGGDWYDVLPLDEHRTMIIVGDVVGHGVEAAARMTSVRSSINTLARLGTPFHHIIPEAEQLLLADDVDYLGTASLHLVDLEQGTITYVRAGHPPAVLCTSDGFRLLDGAGRAPLGVGGAVDAATVAFGRGDILVAYTDGLVERRGELLDAGVERVARVACEHRASPVEGVVGALVEEALHDDARRDDVALAIVRRV